MPRAAKVFFAALLAAFVTALPVNSDMVERDTINSEGISTSFLVNRAFLSVELRSAQYPTDDNQEDFFPTNTYESLCTYEDDEGFTSGTSPFIEDCAYILSYIRYQLRGFWNFSRLIPGQDYALVEHNTCTLYYRAEDGHTSIQIATGDIGSFVDNAIRKYRRDDYPRFPRVEATGSLTCYEANGIAFVNTTLSLKA